MREASHKVKPEMAQTKAKQALDKFLWADNPENQRGRFRDPLAP